MNVAVDGLRQPVGSFLHDDVALLLDHRVRLSRSKEGGLHSVRNKRQVVIVRVDRVHKAHVPSLREKGTRRRPRAAPSHHALFRRTN